MLSESLNGAWVPLLILIPICASMLSALCQRWSASIAICAHGLLLFCFACVVQDLLQSGSQKLLLGGWTDSLAIALYVDGLSTVLLSLTSVVGLAVSLYAKAYFSDAHKPSFWVVWLLLIAALNALTLSRDIFNVYVTLECVGLASVVLIVFDQNKQTLTGAMRYLLAALFGSMLYLFGVAFLYHAYGTLDTDMLASRITPGPVSYTAFVLMVSGLMIKAALFPFHFWLPPAHSSAPAPVSAVLSGLVVKASVLLILRLWMDIFSTMPLPYAAECLSGLGLIAIVWASIQALLQTTIKRVIAYSTIAQLGYLLQALTLSSVTAWQGVLYLALSHGFAKSAMFLAAGNIKRFSGHDDIERLNQVVRKLPLTMIAFAIAGMSIMGLPPSSGFIGKWLLLEAALVEGRYVQATVMVVGGLLAMAYVFKIFGHAFTAGKPIQPHKSVSPMMTSIPLVLAILSALMGLTAVPILTVFGIDVPFMRPAA